MTKILSEIKSSGSVTDYLNGALGWSVIPTGNATHTGDVTGATALTIDKSAITGKTNVAAALNDSILISDFSNFDNLKSATIQSIVDLVPPYTLAIGNSVSGGTTNKLLAIGSLTALTQLTLGAKLSITGSTLNVASLAIGDAVGSGTASSILFIDPSGNLGQANSTFQRNSSGNFGIGTTADASYRVTISAGADLNLKLAGSEPLIKFAPTSYLSGNGAEMYQNSAGKFFLNVNNSTSAFVFDTSGNVGFGVSTMSAKVHAQATTQQLRIGYDASNYASVTVGSTGIVTLDAVGSAAKFVFFDDVELSDKNLIFGTTTGTKIGTGATQKIAFHGATPIVQDTGWSVSGFTTRRTFNNATDTIGDFRDMVCTYIQKMIDKGVIGA